MYVRKIAGLKIVCPHCGSEITMTWDEYDKYRKETEDFGCSSIICQRKGEDGKSRSVVYTNFDCPACGGYIPVTIGDEDTDELGFAHSVCVNPIYGTYDEVNIDDYIKKALGTYEVDETEDN